MKEKIQKQAKGVFIILNTSLCTQHSGPSDYIPLLFKHSKNEKKKMKITQRKNMTVLTSDAASKYLLSVSQKTTVLHILFVQQPKQTKANQSVR